MGEPKPGSRFETCLSHFDIGMSQQDLFWPCLCPAATDVELWPCQSLYTLCHPFLPPMSPHPTKNLPPYVPNLYKGEADAITLRSCFDTTLGPGVFLLGCRQSPFHSAPERLGWEWNLSPLTWPCWQGAGTSILT